MRSKVSPYSLIANMQLPTMIFEICFLTERLLQGSTQKPASASAPLVWLPKGSWWASYPVGSHLLPQLTTPSAVLGHKRMFLFLVGMLSEMLWVRGLQSSVCSPSPPGQGCALCPRWPGCSWDNAHTAWCEVLSLTHSSGVIVDRAGSATGNWNRS